MINAHLSSSFPSEIATTGRIRINRYARTLAVKYPVVFCFLMVTKCLVVLSMVGLGLVFKDSLLDSDVVLRQRHYLVAKGCGNLLQSLVSSLQ